MTINVMQVKNDYFLLPKFKLHRYQQMNGFLYCAGLTEKKYGKYISHKLIAWLIPT